MTEVNRQCAHCDERELDHATDGGCQAHGCGCPGFSQSEYADRPSGPHWTAMAPPRCPECGGRGLVECPDCDGAAVLEAA